MTDETEPTPRITRIEVTGLFGLYDHVIKLNLEDRVTILHGPNGVGKTVLLKMIHALLTGQSDSLAPVPFRRFKLDLTSGETIDIHSTIETSITRAQRSISRKTLTSGTQPSPFLREYTLGPVQKNNRTDAFVHPPWLPAPGNGDLLEPTLTIPRVYLIGDQRITRTARNLPAVLDNADDLQDKIDDRMREYGSLAQSLDQTFPTRLLQRSGQGPSVNALKQRMASLTSLRAKLQHIGILDERRAKPFNVASLDGLTEAQSDVMALYVGDNEEKLAIFDGLLSRVELFLRIVNARFRNKSVRADHRQGMIVVNHHDQPIELGALSSGEQQQLVLTYDLLFRVPANTLVLIDEPELSLHVLWQKRFLSDLLEIVKAAGIDALIATHSPFIVGDRSDLMVALDAEIDHDEPVAT